MCVSDEALCIPCLFGGTNSEDPIANLSEAELREALSDKIEVPASLTMGELQELYISIVEGNSMDSLGSHLLEQVVYPMYQPSALDPNGGQLKFLSRFDLRDGGRFLRDQALSSKAQCGLVNLLANLVTFRKSIDKPLPKTAEVLPCMISECATNSRVDSGERLMKRCVRHALDTKTPSILHSHKVRLAW